jgi:predicted HAD superfamily hydrolase
MRELCEYAQELGKKIIVTSDMYLSAEFLGRMLERCGYGKFCKIYVSSEIGRTKASGNLFRHMAADLGVDAGNILHIGDNQVADANMARETGLSSLRYVPPCEKFLASHPREAKYLALRPNDVTASVSFALRSMRAEDGGYWRGFGYAIGGPLAYGFAKSVADIAAKRGLSDLFFIARDGYTLKAIYDMISDQDSAKSHYVHASRKVKIGCMPDYDGDEYTLEAVLTHYFPEQQFRSQLDMKKCHRDNLEAMRSICQPDRKAYAEYAAAIVLKGRKIAVIDTIGRGFSAQKLIEGFFAEKDIIGIYLRTIRQNDTHSYVALDGFQFHRDKRLNWELVEFLLAAPEPPTERIRNKRPVYSSTNESEQNRSTVCADVSKGEMDFSRDVIGIFGKSAISFSITEAMELLIDFSANMEEEDIAHLGKIDHPVDANNTRYAPLLGTYTEKSKHVLNLLRQKMNQQTGAQSD